MRFTDCVQMDLIDGTDGYVVDPVAEGFIRMDDHEDSSVYETARVLTDHPPVLLVADDMSFIQKSGLLSRSSTRSHCINNGLDIP